VSEQPDEDTATDTPDYDPWLMQDYERDAESWDGDTRVTPPGQGPSDD
jgi:hypothetical protein